MYSVFVLALVLAATLAGGPAAAQNDPSRSAPAQPEAADQALGTALMFAVVSTTGSLSRGAGAVSAQKALIPNGGYEVIFNRDVRDCAFVAGLGDPSIAGGSGSGSVRTARRDNNVNGVWVNTFAANGTLTDRSFHLMVFCTR